MLASFIVQAHAREFGKVNCSLLRDDKVNRYAIANVICLYCVLYAVSSVGSYDCYSI